MKNSNEVIVAIACHTANRAFCIGIGDLSQLPWEDAPEWQKESAVLGVQKALNGAGPEELHQSWTNQKIADGWVYGEEKDAVKKTHPCLVPYSELPAHQREKDFIFKSTVETFRKLQFCALPLMD